ncbi:Uncharacterised protein [Citrobacter koseri]|uniref:Uncharacterized protein n=1 Tax=Citrobacter koseri TaxID=545 RepID=A0A2X2WQN2_CITKO|nr:Uncharacterised protein [Citrobacter koseri]
MTGLAPISMALSGLLPAQYYARVAAFIAVTNAFSSVSICPGVCDVFLNELNDR